MERKSVMVSKSIGTINVGSVDGNDSLFQISPVGEIDSLAASIEKVGIINPIILQRKEAQHHRIVAGFRRFAAVSALGFKEMPAFIVDDAATDLELFHLALQDNLSTHNLNPIEVSIVIHKLTTVFHLEKAAVVQRYLPLLGYGSNPQVYDLYAPLCKLDEDWQQLIIGDLVSTEIASSMASVNDQDRSAFLMLIRVLQPGKNRQRELWALLNDLSRMHHTSLADLVQEGEFANILADQKLTPSQKAERFRIALLKQRHPKYMQIQARFDALMKESKIPPDLHIRPSSFFAGEDFQVGFAFKSEAEYQEKLQILTSIMQNGAIKQMIELT